MAKYSKKIVLDLPLKVILTDDGVASFIQRKKPLQKFRLVDDTEEYGIMLTKFAPQSLQQLINLNFIAKIEMVLPEISPYRLEILDLSKLLVYSMFYREFNVNILQLLLKTEVIKQHNKTHPGQYFNETTQIDEKIASAFINSKSKQLEFAHKQILGLIEQEIMNDSQYNDEEKKTYVAMSHKFLTTLNMYNKFLLIMCSQHEDFFNIVASIQNILRNYREKSRVADYIALMLMELATYAETVNLKNQIKKMYHTTEDYNSVLVDKFMRSMVVHSLVDEDIQVCLTWKFGSRASSIGKQNHLHIILYNKETNFLQAKENIEAKKSANIKKENLVDFYRNQAGEEKNDLGLYYLSYLDEACSELNIKFVSFVNFFAKNDLTVINLLFDF